jgi:hypothetical protein
MASLASGGQFGRQFGVVRDRIRRIRGPNQGWSESGVGPNQANQGSKTGVTISPPRSRQIKLPAPTASERLAPLTAHSRLPLCSVRCQDRTSHRSGCGRPKPPLLSPKHTSVIVEFVHVRVTRRTDSQAWSPTPSWLGPRAVLLQNGCRWSRPCRVSRPFQPDPKSGLRPSA